MRAILSTLRADERGSISVFAAVFALAAVTLVSLVVDGAAALRAVARADALAAEAARAAADTVDLRGTTPVIDPAAAVTAARAYLAGEGVAGSVTVTGPRTVSVTVTLRQRYAVPIPGVGPTYDETGHATATLDVGVTRGDR